jgi:putative oxidoreductase
MSDRARLETIAYTALRIVAGALLACHGAQKLFGLFGKAAQPVGSQLWIGGVIELVGGVLVALGVQARIAAFLVSGTMAVAYFQFHWKLAVAGARFLPIVNGGELAVVYCFVFLLIAVRGPGPHALGR